MPRGFFSGCFSWPSETQYHMAAFIGCARHLPAGGPGLLLWEIFWYYFFDHFFLLYFLCFLFLKLPIRQMLDLFVFQRSSFSPSFSFCLSFPDFLDLAFQHFY